MMLLWLSTWQQLSAAEIYTFDLIPVDGIVAGPAGTTVGWGYSITNQSATNWLVTSVLNSDFFVNGTPALLFDFPEVAPGATVTQPFNLAGLAGLYALTWNLTAPDDFANFGVFTLSGQWWAGSPLAGGVFLQDAPDSRVSYFALVAAADGQAVPEPASWAPILALAILFLLGNPIRARRDLGEQQSLNQQGQAGARQPRRPSGLPQN